MRDNWGAFVEHDIAILGVNPGSGAGHRKFSEKHEFPFPLLIDKGKKTATRYGAGGLFVKRTVYGIDQTGKIAFVERGMPSPAAILQALTMRGRGDDKPTNYMTEKHRSDPFVTVFSSREVHAEIEADTIHGLLESAGLQSMIFRENVQELPIGNVSVRVTASDEQEARTLIAEAQRNAPSPDEGDSLE